MSEKTPFDESFQHKMNELPLPDENEAWQKMKVLLEEKKDRKPFLFFRYEKVAGVLLLLFLGLWLMVAPEKRNSATEIIDAQHKQVEANNIPQQNLQKQAIGTTSKDKEIIKRKDNLLSSKKLKNQVGISAVQTRVSVYENKVNAAFKKQPLSERKSTSARLFTEKIAHTKSDSNKNTSAVKNGNGYKVSNDSLLHHQTEINKEAQPAETVAGIAKDDSLSLSRLKDSAHLTTINTNSSHTAENTLFAAKTMIKIKQRNAYFIDAGAGIKQQLPFNGQKITAYNYNGDKALLKDYIPSGYITLEKDKQWFLQAEFYYATPRLVKDFVYWQHSQADYVHGNTTFTQDHLQKTFYNQVPVSFNVYLHSSWSLGAGIAYSWLKGTVANRQIITMNTQPNSQLSEEQMRFTKGYTDSFLYRSQTGLLIQANYEKNRWTAGVRYLQDIQPYITYTLPNGTKKDKLNVSFELMIHYRLFRSGKFRLFNPKQE